MQVHSCQAAAPLVKVDPSEYSNWAPGGLGHTRAAAGLELGAGYNLCGEELG